MTDDIIIGRKRYHMSQGLRRSRTRLKERIDDIISQRKWCTHQRTRTHIEPTAIDGKNDVVLEGLSYTQCIDCLAITGAA